MSKYLKYYLGMDKLDYQEGEKNEFTITSYASNVLSIYYKKKNIIIQITKNILFFLFLKKIYLLIHLMLQT